MKQLKSLFLLAALVATITFTGCDSTSDTVTPPTTTKQGVTIKSVPAGAEVVYNNRVLGVTPLTLDTLKAGTAYSFKLMLSNHNDSLLTYTPTASKVEEVTKTMTGTLVTSTAIMVYESSDNTAGHFSGISLRLGKALSASVANKDSLDLYYFSDRSAPKFEIRTLPTPTYTRVSWLKVGSTTLTDGADATVKDASWVSFYSDQATNYYFVYDQDQHYSKIKITGRGGLGTTGSPSWVEVQWIYNKAANNIYF